ncbi:MAG: hypothetical protein WC928_02545 [Patescibacteria group bacterium]|jgi:hypothetical protein
MKNFENYISPDFDGFCSSKAGSIAGLIKDAGYRVASPEVQNKINKAVLEIINKHNLTNLEDNKNLLFDKILKFALERISQDLGGSLSLYENLEKTYFDLLVAEAREIIMADPDNFSDFKEINNLVKKINKNKILDNFKAGELIDALVEETSFQLS